MRLNESLITWVNEHISKWVHKIKWVMNYTRKLANEYMYKWAKKYMSKGIIAKRIKFVNEYMGKEVKAYKSILVNEYKKWGEEWVNECISKGVNDDMSKGWIAGLIPKMSKRGLKKRVCSTPLLLTRSSGFSKQRGRAVGVGGSKCLGGLLWSDLVSFSFFHFSLSFFLSYFQFSLSFLLSCLHYLISFIFPIFPLSFLHSILLFFFFDFHFSLSCFLTFIYPSFS